MRLLPGVTAVGVAGEKRPAAQEIGAKRGVLGAAHCAFEADEVGDGLLHIDRAGIVAEGIAPFDFQAGVRQMRGEHEPGGTVVMAALGTAPHDHAGFAVEGQAGIALAGTLFAEDIDAKVVPGDRRQQLAFERIAEDVGVDEAA